MKLMAKKHQKLYQNAKICYIFSCNFEDKNSKHESYRKVWNYCYYTREHRGAAYSIYNIKYSTSKIVPIVFLN